jgi:hypothetical protein
VDRRRVGAGIEWPTLGHHHDHVVGGVLPRPVRDAQPDVRRVESSCRPDDDLVVSSAVEAEVEPGPAPRRDDQISEQRVQNGSERADGDENRGPGVDGGAEDGG